MSGGIPSLAAPSHDILYHDKEWKSHQLPKEDISIPREHQPDPEAESIPSTKQDTPADLERRWFDSGVNRIYVGPAHTISAENSNNQ